MTEHAQPDHLLQVHRRLDAQDTFMKAQDGRISRLETQQAVTDVNATHIRASLDKIESGQTWLIRLVIGGILAGVLAFMIRGGFNVG